VNSRFGLRLEKPAVAEACNVSNLLVVTFEITIEQI
jgi:hypothetical protein